MLTVVCELGVLRDFVPNKSHKKNDQYSQRFRIDFEVFLMHDFLCQSDTVFPLSILVTRRIDAFWSEGIGTFWSEGIRTIWHRKSQTKNQQNSQRVLNYNNCSCIMFHAKLSRNSHFTHYLHTTQATHYLPTPISFISDLAYITRINPILWLNLNYKKLLKCVNTTNF